MDDLSLVERQESGAELFYRRTRRTFATFSHLLTEGLIGCNRLRSSRQPSDAAGTINR
jgi:hypothetical protein